MKRSALWAAAMAVAMLGGGCANIDKQPTITVKNPFVAHPDRPLADVPVPVGFAMKTNGSYIFDNNFRCAKLLYRGTPHVEASATYFKEQMPASRWTLVRDSGIDDREITFQNDTEECKVKLARSGGITSLEIEIKPRPT